jgi:hypothetical protein
LLLLLRRVVPLLRPQAYEEIGHTDNAEKILGRFKIGELP